MAVIEMFPAQPEAAMRKLGFVLMVGAALHTWNVTPAQEGGFQTPVNSDPVIPLSAPLGFWPEDATDIVVTDPDGRVLESWRGELRRGHTVRLGPALLTPANALPWGCLRLRPDRTLSGAYTRYTRKSWSNHEPVERDPTLAVWPAFPTVADTELRLVLFLRKEGTTGAGAIWLPAASSPIRHWVLRPAALGSQCHYDPNTDFATSVAWVEAGRVLVFQQAVRASAPSDVDPATLRPVALDLARFKREALAVPTPLSFQTADTDVRQASFPPTALNLGERIWATPPK